MFNIFKNDNEVIAELEAKVKALKAELEDCRSSLKACRDSSSKTLGHYIDTALAFASEAVRADDLEEELKALKEKNGRN